MNEEEFKIKLKRIYKYCTEKDIDGVILSRVDNFAWISTGCKNYVGTFSQSGEASFFITRRRKYIISNNIEGPRLATEEFKSSNIELIEYPWSEKKLRLKILEELTGNKKIRTDQPIPGYKLLNSDFDKLKYSLTKFEIERYKKLGRDCANILEGVCKTIKKGQTELAIAGKIAYESWKRDVVPIVILIAADERTKKFRHPLPTPKKVSKQVMVVMCGRRDGLIVSLSRIVSLGKPDKQLIKKHEAVCNVDAAFILNTRPGEKLGNIFKRAMKVYDYYDFPDEWELHHQGGPTGYATRYYVATPDDRTVILENEAFAWNPSITGTKSEDTIITTKQAAINITQTRSWPKLTVSYNGQKISRPNILILR